MVCQVFQAARLLPAPPKKKKKATIFISPTDSHVVMAAIAHVDFLLESACVSLCGLVAVEWEMTLGTSISGIHLYEMVCTEKFRQSLT